MRGLMLLIFALALAAQFNSANQPERTAPQNRSEVLTIRVNNEAITPVTARFIARSIRIAEERQFRCLIIFLDTPGGLVEATRDVVKSILHSKVPVVVYVAPTGARAASAGVFITMAAHIAAMAPATNIGAAHPVSIGGLPTAPPQPREKQPAEQPEEKEGGETRTRAASPAEEKTVSDTVAWARSLAELRGRNVEWVTRAVRESASASASEAVEAGAVDMMAEDLNDLLRKIDGREVTLLDGKVNLQVAGAAVRSREMWWGERLLAVIANPNLAIMLLIFGFYGILFELYSPGWGIAGTAGIICLVLGFFALSVLPVNYVGLALIAIALALFVAEAFAPSFGLLTVSGVVCLILGGLMLVDSPAGFIRVSPWLIAPVALATAVITFFLVANILKAHRLPAQTGAEVMAGEEAVAEEDFIPDENRYAGLVRMRGELWRAVSPTPVTTGQRLEIRGREGLTLSVSPVQPSGVHVANVRRERRRNAA
ncbi:MAG TPA: nodulation protein NfeD [Blastocatellia bacterium]